MKNLHKCISIFLSIATICFCFFILRDLYGCICMYQDDIDTTMMCLPLCPENTIKFPSNGMYLAGTANRLFGTVFPYLLGIHPSDFKLYYFCYIGATFMLYGIFSATALFTRKISIVLPFALLSTFSLFLQFFKYDISMMFVYDGMFRMLLPVFLWLNVFLLLCENIKKFSVIKSLTIIVLAFLSVITNEYTAVAMFISVFLYTFLSFYDTNNKKENLFNIMTVIVCLLGLYVLYLTNAFERKNDAGVSDMHNLFRIVYTLPGFFKSFFNNLILSRPFIYLSVIIQTIMILYKQTPNQQTKRGLKLSFSMLAGIIIFNLLLIKAGKTCYNGDWWFTLGSINAIYCIMLLGVNFSLFKLLPYNRTKKNIFAILVFLTVICIYLKDDLDHYASFKTENLIPTTQATYKAEKQIRLAALQGRIAKLNENMKTDPNLWPFSNYDYMAEPQENTVYIGEVPYLQHMCFTAKLFKKELGANPAYIFVDEKTSLDDFYSHGGVFTDEELNNLRFTKLYDDNFVLNKK